MQMRMKVLLLNGHEFVGRWVNCTQKEYDDTKAQTSVYLPDLNKIELPMENGDLLLIPKTAAQSAVLIIQKRD